MLQEVQRHIDTINQKEAFSSDDSIRQMVNDAMQDITFNFSKIGDEEMQLISGDLELQEKWQHAIRAFTQNIDQEDPEVVTLCEVFMQRFKKHGFVVDTIDEFDEYSRALYEILKKLEELQKRNKELMRKYNDDPKFARVHKRVKEERPDAKRLAWHLSFLIMAKTLWMFFALLRLT